MKGMLFYSLYGFGGALFTAGAWYAARRAKAPRQVRALLGVACSCSAAVLLLTIPAAPLMWKVGSAPRDAATLASLLDRFTFWTTLRIVCVDVSFVAVIAAMTSIVLTCRAVGVAENAKQSTRTQRRERWLV
ncbi:MAG: hypothetical protein ABI895_13260 [Deltaproteobacteria bacterium]